MIDVTGLRVPTFPPHAAVLRPRSAVAPAGSRAAPAVAGRTIPAGREGVFRRLAGDKPRRGRLASPAPRG